MLLSGTAEFATWLQLIINLLLLYISTEAILASSKKAKLLIIPKEEWEIFAHEHF